MWHFIGHKRYRNAYSLSSLNCTYTLYACMYDKNHSKILMFKSIQKNLNIQFHNRSNNLNSFSPPKLMSGTRNESKSRKRNKK